MLDKLFSQLSNNTLVLTANNRLSTWLIQQFNAKQTQHTWETPNILPMQTWLANQWNTALLRGETNKRLLTPFQEKLLWQQIISDNHENALLHIGNTANNAQHAWRLFCEWELQKEIAEFDETENCKQFCCWIDSFLIACDENQCLSPSLLTHDITRLFQTKFLAAPKQIFLLGFLEKTPVLTHLINVLNENGTRVEEINLVHSNQSSQRVALQDTETEIITMACWAKATYQKHKKIACIVPELNQHRVMIERVFGEVFQDQKDIFNISSGMPLSNEPVIEIALSILELNAKKIMINDFGHLLRSPFIVDAENQISNRALLDESIRAIGNITYSLSELSDIITEKMDATLYQTIRQLLDRKTPEKQTPSAWSKTFIDQLKIWGWPGERTLNSREFQAVEHFKKALNTFARLESIIPRTNTFTGIQTLRQLCASTLFQPQTTTTPIQILGMLEMNGLTFDDAWIMGLDHLHWPSKPRPNPLLPIKLQRQYKIPHASSERELDFCKLMTKQFLNCAQNIICSYPKQNLDFKLTTSSLIQHLPDIVIDDLKIPHTKSTEEKLLASESIEKIIDNQAAPISETEKVRGGTSIFKLQAACPFRAFAALRLQSESISEPEIGLNASDRGLLVHKTLELFWRVTKTHEKLITSTSHENESLVIWCVNKSIAETLENRHISKSLMTLEKQRLKKLIIEWLEIEKTREPFVVIAQEKWQKATIGKISFRMKADRIDQLSNQTYALIDYKTGKTNINQWFGERLDEPQLPLYAICEKEPIKAIAFAQLNVSDIRFKGVGIEDNLLPGVKKLAGIDWDEQIKQWTVELTNLANAFYNGDAMVDPKNLNLTCRYCDLHTLCRIYEK